MKTKRILSILVALTLVLFAVGCSSSQQPAPSTPDKGSQATTPSEDNFPVEPIRFIIPNNPGGAIETIVRKFQPYVEAELGVPLLIENIGGGGGIIGTSVVAKARADGYTLSAKSIGSLVNSWVLQGAEYTVDDFDYLARFTNDPGVVLVHKDAPYDTLTEFVEWVKTQPAGSVTMSLANITDINFLGLRSIEEAAGIDLNIVGFNGGGAARLAVVSGEVVGTHCNYFGASAVWDDTKVLAIHTDVNNVPNLAGVQTVNEALGVTTPEISTKFILHAPKGLSEQHPERAKKIMDAFNAAWNNPEFQQMLKDSGEEGFISVIDGASAEAEVRAFNDYVIANKDQFSVK